MKWTICALLLLSGAALATPRQSLTAGTPCVACHVNPNGGEGRTELGWSSMNHAGALTFDQMGLQSLHDVTSNQFLDIASLGFDARLQGARLGRPQIEDKPDGGTETTYPDMTWFPMQFQPYLTLKPTSKITLYGTWLMGPSTLRDGEFCDPVFPGMSCFGAQAIFEPGGTAPTVRVGVFQPSIGIRHDDHTILLRGDAANRRQPVIAPGYAEVGAETIYQPRQWLRMEAGLFGTQNIDDALNSVQKTAELWPVAYSARIAFMPHLEFGGEPAGGGGDDEFDDDFDDFDAEPATPFVVNTWIGGSAFGSKDFMMLNGFLGAGIHEGVTLMAEMSAMRRTVEYDQLNAMLNLTYTPWSWITAALRAERAHTRNSTGEFTTWQYVGGLEFFPVPYLEVRPEYRLVETDEYRFGQATLQVHLFY